jgi:hypothetical protein
VLNADFENVNMPYYYNVSKKGKNYKIFFYGLSQDFDAEKQFFVLTLLGAFGIKACLDF